MIAPVRLGEHFSITVAAIDSGGKTNQAVMDVSCVKATLKMRYRIHDFKFDLCDYKIRSESLQVQI